MTSPLLVEGLVKWKTSPISKITFKADGAVDHAGIPYIRSIQTNNMLRVSGINSDDVIKTYNINGNNGNLQSRKVLAATKTRAYLPVVSGGYAIGPWGTVGTLYVDNLNLYLGRGNVIHYKKGTSIKSGDSQLPNTHKLLGFIPNSAQNKAMCITTETTDDPNDGYSYSSCFYHIINTKGDVVETGIVDGSVSIHTFGFGRSSQLDYVCSVLEVNNPYVWSAKGDGDGEVCLYKYEANVLSLITSLIDDNGINDSSYFPANPSLIIRSGTLFIVAGDVVYQYKRQAIQGMGYSDAQSWLGEIIATESFYSGLINDYSFQVGDGSSNYKDKFILLSDNLSDSSFYGFITSGGPIRDNFEQLRSIGFFDIVPKGYSVSFKGRGSQEPVNVATYDGQTISYSSKIPFAHIGAFEGIGPATTSLEHDFEMESQLPRKVEVKFQDIFRNFDMNIVQSISEDSRSQTVESIDSPIVMAYNTAANLASVMRKMRWAERHSFAFTLPAIYCTLEPGDVVKIEIPFDTGFLLIPIKIATVNYKTSGLISVTAKATSGVIYTQEEAYVEPDVDVTDPDSSESSFGEILDIPPINVLLETYKAFMVFATGLVDPWGGCSFLRSDDEGQTYINIAEFTTPCTMGNAKTITPSHQGLLIDRGSQINIAMIYGELLSTDDHSFYYTPNSNLIAWGSADRGWEIIKFKDVTLELDGTYTVSYLLRGLYGTEWMTGLHELDDLFILLGNGGKTILMPSSSVGVEKVYKVIDIGDDIESVPEDSFTYTAANLKPFSPCKPKVEILTGGSAGDAVLSWTRRSRFDNGWQDNIEVPLNETTELYTIQILNPSGDVVRTMTSAVPSITYHSINQIADLGSAPSTFHFNVYQISSVVGRGFPLEAHVNV